MNASRAENFSIFTIGADVPFYCCLLGGRFNTATGRRGGDRRFRKISEEQSGNVSSSSSSSRTGAAAQDSLPGSSGFNGNPGVAHRTTLRTKCPIANLPTDIHRSKLPILCLSKLLNSF